MSAFAFRNKDHSVTNVETVALTAPNDKQLILIGCRVSNKGNMTGNLTLIRYSASEDQDYFLCGKETPLPIGSAINIVDGNRVVLLAGDQIKIIGNENDLMDLSIDYLELNAG